MASPWSPIVSTEPPTFADAVRLACQYFDQRARELTFDLVKQAGLDLIAIANGSQSQVELSRVMSDLGAGAWRSLRTTSSLTEDQAVERLRTEMISRRAELETVRAGGLPQFLSTLSARLETLPANATRTRAVWVDVMVLATFYKIVSHGWADL